MSSRNEEIACATASAGRLRSAMTEQAYAAYAAHLAAMLDEEPPLTGDQRSRITLLLSSRTSDADVDLRPCG